MPPEILLPAAGTAIAAVAGVLFKVLTDQIADLRRERDEAIAGWRGQTDATEEVTRAMQDLSREQGRLIGELVKEVRALRAARAPRRPAER